MSRPCAYCGWRDPVAIAEDDKLPVCKTCNTGPGPTPVRVVGETETRRSVMLTLIGSDGATAAEVADGLGMVDRCGRLAVTTDLWRLARKGVLELDGRTYDVCQAAAGPVADEGVPMGRVAVTSALQVLGSATVAEITARLVGRMSGSKEARARRDRVASTIADMLRAKLVEASGRRGRLGVYRLTGTVADKRIRPRPAIDQAIAAASRLEYFTAGQLAEVSGLSVVRSTEIARRLAVDGLFLVVQRGHAGRNGSTIYRRAA